ncbi:MAG TPA: vanadium-dependent haloperoxidase [Vicinamibacterales bacterium]|nr:vanadium-dependent haloperoxidase [Vicinamibacterales bacterium]
MTKMMRCGIGVLLVVVGATSARADDVTDWNAALFRSALVAGSSPLNMSRFTALVQAAVFDAVNGIDQRYTPIHVAQAGPTGASRRAAAVYAAYDILSRLYGQTGLFLPNQQSTLDGRLAASLASIAARESPASIASGRDWGLKVSEAIWTWRSTDGFSLDPPIWVGFTTLGQWRQTPNAPYPGISAKGAGYPQYPTMTPWAIESPSQFRAVGPPALTSAQYAKDFNESKLMGRQTSAARTADETVYSWFWAGSASYLWNHVALTLLEGRHDHSDDREKDSEGDRRDTLLRNARILALLDVAMADAAIGCWDTKYTYNFWRPITAIRETADDGNPATTPDPTWTPLFATPAHPDYTSGHSCVSGAAAAILAHEFGEHTRFDVTSDLMIGVTRSFHNFTDALEEVKNARVFAGIHFRTATDDGANLGKAVAQYVLEHKFQRTH